MQSTPTCEYHHHTSALGVAEEEELAGGDVAVEGQELEVHVLEQLQGWDQAPDVLLHLLCMGTPHHTTRHHQTPQDAQQG